MALKTVTPPALIGNSAVQTYLQKSAKNGIVPHAQLWIGPEHVGKTTFLENYLDLLKIDRKVAVQWFEASELDMDTARRLIQQTTETSLWAGQRFLIIQQAELLRYQVCNALLKVLEEPRSKVTLVLLTSDLERIPATVRSRCSTIWFQRVATAELIAALPDQAELMPLAHGLPGVALSWKKSTSAQKWLQQITQWATVLQQAPAERLASVTDKTTQQLPTQLNQLETALYSVLTLQTTGERYPADLQTQIEPLAARYSVGDTIQALTQLAKLRRATERPVQPKLVMTNLLLNIYPAL